MTKALLEVSGGKEDDFFQASWEALDSVIFRGSMCVKGGGGFCLLLFLYFYLSFVLWRISVNMNKILYNVSRASKQLNHVGGKACPPIKGGFLASTLSHFTKIRVRNIAHHYITPHTEKTRPESWPGCCLSLSHCCHQYNV